MNPILSFVTALGLGLAIGIERENSHPEGSQAFGVRTLTLLALLGALAGAFHGTAVSISLIITSCFAILLGYWRSSQRQARHPDIGLTTELAALMTFVLGYASVFQPASAAAIAAIVLFLLAGRVPIHELSRKIIRPKEIRAASLILLAVLSLLPMAPRTAIDPWGLFVPYKMVLAFVLIAFVQFSAYLLARFLGNRYGNLVSSFLGGLVSSTAVTLYEARQSNSPQKAPLHHVASVLLATCASFFLGLVLIYALAPKAFFTLGSPIAAGLGTGLALVAFMQKKGAREGFRLPSNPLALRSALGLSLFLIGVLAAVGAAQKLWGDVGSGIAVFLGGLFEFHTTLSSLLLSRIHEVSGPGELVVPVGLVSIASLLSKITITAVVARHRVRRWLLAGLFLMAVSTLLVTGFLL